MTMTHIGEDLKLKDWKGFIVEHTRKQTVTFLSSNGTEDKEVTDIEIGVLCQKRNGKFYVDSRAFNCPKREIEPADEVTLLFTPHKNKVSHICEKCYLEVFPKDRQNQFSSLSFHCRSYKCSVCNRVPKYDGLLVKMGLVATMPLWVWEFDLEGLLQRLEVDHLVKKGSGFLEANEVYSNRVFAIQSVSRNAYVEGAGYAWTLGNFRQTVRADMPRPPHVEEWDSGLTWEDLKLIAERLQYTGTNVNVYWKPGEAERSFTT